MSPLVHRIARRLLATVGGFALAAWVLSLPDSGTFAANSQDGVLFFLAAAMFAAILPRGVRFYTVPVVSSSELVSLAMSAVAVGFVISTMSSVHIRAAGHFAPLYDGPSRVVFRLTYIVFAAAILLTAGPYEPDVFRSAAASRWRRLAYVLGFSLAILALFSYSDRGAQWLRTRQEIHDTAPGSPDTDAIP